MLVVFSVRVNTELCVFLFCLFLFSHLLVLCVRTLFVCVSPVVLFVGSVVVAAMLLSFLFHIVSL